MKYLPKILILAALLFLQRPVTATTLDDAWKAFNENNRGLSRNLFTKALSEPSSKAEAYLGLSFLDYKEGKEDASFEDVKAFCAIAPDPYPYLYALWSSGVLSVLQQKLTDDRVDFLNKILKDPKANGTIKAIATQQLGYNAFYIGKVDDAFKYFSDIRSVDSWQLTGTFDNVSGSGFDKAYKPITTPSADAVFANRYDANVKWFKVPQSRNDKWVDFAYSFNYNNSIIYAQTFVNSPADQDVVLRIGVSGSMKVWINDALVGAEADERNTDLDVYNYRTHLSKGNNRILVQIGESESDHANFLLRLTDEKGIPLEGLTVSADPQPYKPQATIRSEQIPLFAESFFEAKIKERPDDIVNYYLLADVYLRNDKVYEARKVLYTARTLAPNSGYLSRKFIEAYTREGNTTDESKEEENLKKIDPDNIASIQSLIDEAQNKEDYDEMERLTDKLEKLYGQDQRTLLYRLAIAGYRKKTEDIVKVVEEGYKKYPETYSFVKMKAAIEQEVNQNLKGAIGVYEKFYKNNNTESAMEDLSSLYFKNGMPEKGARLYENAINNKPYAVGYISQLTQYYTEVKNYQKAISYANKALEFAPYIGSYWANLGKVYYAMDQNDKAIEYLKKAIYYGPYDYENKKLLRKLQGEEDLYSYFPKVDVDKIARQGITVPVTEDDNSVILHNETQRIIYTEGGSEEKQFLVSRILTKSGVDDWKEYQIDFNPYTQRLIIEQAKIIKPNGSKIDAERNNSYLVFTGLEVGDVIVIVYRLENYMYGKLANDFWEKNSFNGFYPFQHVRVSYIIPKNKKFEYKNLNTDIAPLKTPVENDYMLYTWEAQDQPSLKPEQNMPSLNDVGKFVFISSLPDWSYVASSYADMSTSKAKANYEVKELVGSLFKDKANLSETEKAKTIYEWIVDNIHYSHISFRQSGLVPQKASTTINTRLGDCKDLATLFVSMAKEVGLKANLVLINTNNNGTKDLLLPSLDFNHCIAKVTADGRDYYLELTYPQLSFSTQPSSLIGSMSLNIPNSGAAVSSELSVLPRNLSLPNHVRRETEISFDNNDILIKRLNVHYGSYAAERREGYQEKSMEEREKDVQRSISNSFTKPVKLISTEWSDLNQLIDSVSCTYTYVVKGGLTEFGGMKIFELPWTDAENTPGFLSTDNRNYDINFWTYDYADEVVETIRIKIPAGKTLVELPKSQKYTFKGDTYTLNYKLSGNELIAERRVVYTERVIPSASYGPFREFFNKLIQEDHKQIGFK